MASARATQSLKPLLAEEKDLINSGRFPMPAKLKTALLFALAGLIVGAVIATLIAGLMLGVLVGAGLAILGAVFGFFRPSVSSQSSPDEIESR